MEYTKQNDKKKDQQNTVNPVMVHSMMEQPSLWGSHCAAMHHWHALFPWTSVLRKIWVKCISKRKQQQHFPRSHNEHKCVQFTGLYAPVQLQSDQFTPSRGRCTTALQPSSSTMKTSPSRAQSTRVIKMTLKLEQQVWELRPESVWEFEDTPTPASTPLWILNRRRLVYPLVCCM